MYEDGQRLYRPLVQHHGEALDQFFHALEGLIARPFTFIQHPSVQSLHTTFRQIARMGSLAYKLLRMRHRWWPFKAFSITEDARVQQELKNCPECLLDSWSRQLLHSPHGVNARDSQAALQCIAEMMPVDTVSTERLHAISLRRAKQRVNATPMSIPELASRLALRTALGHSTFMRVQAREPRASRKRGSAEALETQDAVSARPTKKRRRAASIWNAYLSDKLSLPHSRNSVTGFDNATMTELQASFRALTEEERKHYKDMADLMSLTHEERRARGGKREKHKQRKENLKLLEPAPMEAGGDLLQQLCTVKKHAKMLRAQVSWHCIFCL